MKKKIIMSIVVIAIACSMVAGATTAYFTDTQTSHGNTFTAGTLDLNVNGSDSNVVLFNDPILVPGNQPTAAYSLMNKGNINGYLNINNVTVTNLENGITAPEASAGDTTTDAGELGNLVNIHLYFDNDGSGYYSTGDVDIYNGKVSAMPSSFVVNKPINAGQTIKIQAVLDWWSSPNDNLAQGDTMTYSLDFALTQITQ